MPPAGTGAAVADGIYATIAVTFGDALAIVLAPFDIALRVAAVVVLLLLLESSRPGGLSDQADPGPCGP